MTKVIGTIGMVVTRRSTLVAMSDDVVADTFAKAFVKYEVFSNKFIFKAFFSDLSGIFDDATFKLEDIFIALVLHVSACLLTPYAACAVHDDILFFVIGEHITDDGQRLSKCGNIRKNGIFEVPNFAFVVIAHINNNSVGMFQDFIHRLCVEVNTAISDIKGRIIQPVSDNLVTHRYFQFKK